MRLTTFTDYAMRVLLHAATQPGERSTIAEVAAAYGISAHHVVKVVHQLGRAGFLRTSRGKGGGFALASPPEGIRVGDVVRAMEGDLAPVQCVSRQGLRCAIVADCALVGVLDGAMRAFLGVLDGCTLADLLAGERRSAVTLTLHPPPKAIA